MIVICQYYTRNIDDTVPRSSSFRSTSDPFWKCCELWPDCYIRRNTTSCSSGGWTMRSLGDASDFPWWRVLNNAGIISIKGNLLNSAQLQKELLESEGVVVGDDFSLHIERYRFRPDEQMLKSMKLDPEYIRSVLDKYQTD